MKIVIAQKILQANDDVAQANLEKFDAAGILGVNMLGSPGAGKTTLLEAMLPRMEGRLKTAVIEGDLATSRDAERIEALGIPSVQVNTGGGCHLDAGMVATALEALDLDSLDMVVIENVGNLVCTAGFALGERLRIVVLSVTEGDDKVEKYPPMFRKADAVFLNKTDLLPYTDFDVEKTRGQLRRLAPEAECFEVSARTGEGIDAALEWLLSKRKGA